MGGLFEGVPESPFPLQGIHEVMTAVIGKVGLTTESLSLILPPFQRVDAFVSDRLIPGLNDFGIDGGSTFRAHDLADSGGNLGFAALLPTSSIDPSKEDSFDADSRRIWLSADSKNGFLRLFYPELNSSR